MGIGGGLQTVKWQGVVGNWVVKHDVALLGGEVK